MIIFGIFILLILLPFFFDLEDLGPLLFIIGLVGFIFCSGTLISFHYIIQGEIQEIKAIEQTINNARNEDKSFESAAFQIKISEANQKIASWKYYNDTVFDIFIPDVVEDLEPIK